MHYKRAPLFIYHYISKLFIFVINIIDYLFLQKQKKKEMDQQEGWEYAPLFNMKFHSSERKMDMVRRRRWHRKMLAESPNAAAVFSVTGPVSVTRLCFRIKRRTVVLMESIGWFTNTFKFIDVSFLVM